MGAGSTADYTLDATEVILLKEDHLHYGSRQRVADRFELVLTNRRLILVKRLAKLIGTTKEVVAYPIGQIKVFNDQAQVFLSNRTEIEVHLVNGSERFRFDTKRAATKWIETINLVATGREDEVNLNPGASRAIPGSTYVSETLRDTVGTFKGMFGDKPSAPVKTAEACQHCGAPVQGYVGKVVICGHCGHAQELGASPTASPGPTSTTPPVVVAPATAAPPPPPGAVPAPVAEPGWKPDPRGIHEYRWWDGNTWTALIADHGVTANDPV